jgi:AcrR family transcriptional regulator
MDHPVKTPRRYDSSRRRAKARERREAVLDAALRRFLADGFAASTIASISQESGVSVDSIYKTFGGKAGLVRALTERGLRGEGPVPAEERSDLLQATEPEPAEVMRGIGRLVTEVAPRVAPLLILLAEAALADEEMARLRDDISASQLARMTHNARTLARRGILRPGLTVERAADLMWVYSSHQLYQLLVLDRGWTPGQFGDFVADSLGAALLPGTTEAQ